MSYLNLKHRKESISSYKECNSIKKNNLSSIKKTSKKKGKKNNESYEKIKGKKLKSNTFIDFKFDKTILLDIVK